MHLHRRTCWVQYSAWENSLSPIKNFPTNRTPCCTAPPVLAQCGHNTSTLSDAVCSAECEFGVLVQAAAPSRRDRHPPPRTRVLRAGMMWMVAESILSRDIPMGHQWGTRVGASTVQCLCGVGRMQVQRRCNPGATLVQRRCDVGAT
eukprot:gene1011-biopygen18219